MVWRSRDGFGSEEAWLRYRLVQLYALIARVGDQEAHAVLNAMIDETEARLRELASR